MHGRNIQVVVEGCVLSGNIRMLVLPCKVQGRRKQAVRQVGVLSVMRSWEEDMRKEDISLICVCAVRYALGGRSYMPSTVCGIIKGNAGSITTNDLRIMRNDVQDCKDYGMKCDEQTWLGFLGWLNE